MQQTFDFIIVGAGSAGSVLAKRLSENGQHSVCVLEAGGRDLNPFIHIPAGFMKTMRDASVNWLFETEPSAGTAGRRIGQPRGKTLGGSSAINGHIYNRGQRMDFDTWAQMGNRGWGYLDVLPYFMRSERRLGNADERFRGRDGELVVEDLQWHHPLCDAFIEGATSLGIPRNDDYNGESQDGVGYFQRCVHKGRRMSAARAFLHTARKRSNVEVITHAHTLGVRFDGKRATGVRFLRGGVEQSVSARKEVILSAGAFGSPHLLQLSGVGPGALLQELGIPTVHALRGVGENLRDHYPVRLVSRVKNTDTVNERSRGLRLAGEVLNYAFRRQGILTLQPTLVGVFWKSNDALDSGDLQLTFTPASYPDGVQSKLDVFPGVTVAVWQQRPESRGFVRAQTASALDAPAIQPNYLSEHIDQQALVGGIRLGRRLMKTKALEPFFDAEEHPGAEIGNDDELLDFARRRGTTAFHPMGTCRMGPVTDPSAVVDDTLKVHGLEGLRVVDASIMPTMPSANTNAATYMIAEKAADAILNQSPPEPAVL